MAERPGFSWISCFLCGCGSNRRRFSCGSKSPAISHVHVMPFWPCKSPKPPVFHDFSLCFLACGHEKRKNINVVEGLACESHANLELKSSQQRTQAKFSMDKPLSLPMPPPHCTLQCARYALHLAQRTISSMQFQQRRSQAMLRKENTFRFLGFLYFCDGFAWKATKMPGSWHFLCKSHDISEVKFSQQRSPAKFRWTNPLWNHAKLKLFYSVECLVLDRPCFCMLLLYFFEFATSILLKKMFFCPLYKRTIGNPRP